MRHGNQYRCSRRKAPHVCNASFISVNGTIKVQKDHSEACRMAAEKQFVVSADGEEEDFLRVEIAKVDKSAAIDVDL